MFSRLKPLLKSATRSLGVDIKRRRPEFSSGIASLRPDGAPRGIVLLAYILEPFQHQQGKPISTSHTHHRESVLIAETWLKHGYGVDVIDYRNHEFIPRKKYDFFVSARTHLEAIAARLNPDCIKIAHLDTSHHATNNYASYSRLLDLQRRRHRSLPGSARLMEMNRAIEHAHYGVVLGNEVTLGTYRYANKPLFPLDVPTVQLFPRDTAKNFDECRNRFLWLGSGGMVHKGLDIALEAFAGMPDMHLTVCGPVEVEKEFVSTFSQELYHTSNIHTVGWVDIAGADFQQITRNSVGIVYPSCAEGQAGAVITCLSAGIIPIISRETGIHVGEFGLLLKGLSVEDIRSAVHYVAALPAEELAVRARRAWEYAATHHSHNAYRAAYGTIVQAIITDSTKQPTMSNQESK
jgi:glycosyltransferase involved in cell wall biosynthesis